LAWVKGLPENEKETLRKLRAETVRRHKEGLIPVDSDGKSIDEVFGSENEERKMGRFNQPLTYSSFFSAGDLLNNISNAS
jgi:hypothetical protein